MASIFACMGFNQWRREIIERRKIELAEEVLDIFSSFQSRMRAIRLYVSFKEEGKTRAPEGQKPDSGHITLERIDKFDDYFRRIETVQYRFQDYFDLGPNERKFFKEANNILHEIRCAAFTLAGSDLSPQERKPYETIIWYQGADDNLDKRAESVGEGLRQICVPYLKSFQENPFKKIFCLSKLGGKKERYFVDR